ncbi:MAG: hypothetical protein QG656_2525, partial [Candidatus Hydrogenedentes bacterium]|nr:hypothetical protein [Candidatus Hydrogenedentota bacterium]
HDLNAAKPAMERSGCFGQTTPVYDYYYYRVVARSVCGEGDPSPGDEGYVGADESYGGKEAVYEPVLPSKAAADGTYAVRRGDSLAIRLRAETDIDAETVWGEVRTAEAKSDAVAWRLVAVDDPRDGWVVYTPAEPWAAGELISMTAGALTVTGESVGPVTAEFRVESETEKWGSDAAQRVWQPGYDLVDMTGFDLDAESNDAVSVAYADAAAWPAAPGGIGPVYAIGAGELYVQPQRVWLPVPEGVTPQDVQLYYYFGAAAGGRWYAAEDVIGWLGPDGYVSIEIDGVTYLGFLVRHGGVATLGVRGMDGAGHAGASAVPGVSWPPSGDAVVMALIALCLGVAGYRRRGIRRTE